MVVMSERGWLMSSRSVSRRSVAKPEPDVSAMRCMNSMQASTTPTEIATLRSTSTVSTSVTISTTRSSNGARCTKCETSRQSMSRHAVLSSTAARHGSAR